MDALAVADESLFSGKECLILYGPLGPLQVRNGIKALKMDKYFTKAFIQQDFTRYFSFFFSITFFLRKQTYF